MIEKLFHAFGGRKPDTQTSSDQLDSDDHVLKAEQEAVPEKIIRRKNRITGHLENIYRAQGRLESLQNPWLPIPKELRRGGFAALQILMGVTAVHGGLFVRGTVDPLRGSILSYLGAQSIAKGLLTIAHGFLPVPQRKIEKRQGKKKSARGAAAKEKISERDLRGKMAEITEATKARQKEFREYRMKYAGAKEFISPEEHARAREKFLEGYIAHLDVLLDGQTIVFEDEQIVGGLSELSRTIESYYGGLAVPHQEHRDVFGTTAAVSVLTASQYVSEGTPWTLETVAALSAGAAQLFLERLERGEKKVTAQEQFEAIRREIGALKERKIEATLKLERLIQRRLKREKEEISLAGEPAIGTVGEGVEEHRLAIDLSEQDNREVAEMLAQWNATVQGIVRAVPQDALSPQTVAATTVSASNLERGALSGFLGVILPDTLQPEIANEEKPVGEARNRIKDVRDIVPPTFAELEHRHLRREVDKSIIRDIAQIAGRELRPVSEDTGWLDPAPAIREMVQDPDLEEGILDEIARYLADLDAVMTAHQSVRDFQQFHLADIVFLKRDVEKELYLRERARFRDVIMRNTPSGFRNAILKRSRIRDIPDREEESIDQIYFEDSIREWMQKKSTREHDRNSLRQFLKTCEEVLTAIPQMTTKDEKEYVVRRAYDVLNEFLPEVHFPDPEQRLAWNRRIEEVAAAFNRVRYGDTYQVAQRVPEFLQTEQFVPSQAIREVTFAKSELYDDKIKAVDASAIIGSYLDREAWVVHDRARIAELAQPLIDEPTPERLHAFFVSEVKQHDRISLQENIELLRIPGPRGPLYFVYRGIQHVAAAKVAGLPRIVARVRELRPSSYDSKLRIYTKNVDRYDQWIELKEAGLIDGDILPRNQVDIQSGRPLEAKIRYQAVPWLIWFGRITQPDAEGRRVVGIPEISRIYEQLYKPVEGSRDPSPLEKIKDARGQKVDRHKLVSDTEFYRLLKEQGVKRKRN